MEPEELVAKRSSFRKEWTRMLSEKYGEEWSGSPPEGACQVSHNNDVETDQHAMSSVTMNSADSVSTERSHTTSRSADNSSCARTESEADGDNDHSTYSVEIIGGAEPPDEWVSLSERKSPISTGSIDLESQEKCQLIVDDNWRLTERDDETLEVDMRNEAGELNDADAGLASDEESLLRTPIPSSGGGSPKLRTRLIISAEEQKDRSSRLQSSQPTAFPSNFSTIRSGTATELFAERMRSIERKNIVKSKFRLAPVVATIGKFSSAFHKFETRREETRSLMEVHSSSGIKARHSSLSASMSVSADTKQRSPTSPQAPPSPQQAPPSLQAPLSPQQPQLSPQRKLTRIPYPYQPYSKSASLSSSAELLDSTRETKEETQSVASEKSRSSKRESYSKPSNQKSSSSKSPNQVSSSPKSQNQMSASPKFSGSGTSKHNRAANIPVESSRMLRSVRESVNAPDVIPDAVHNTTHQTTLSSDITHEFSLSSQQSQPTSMTFDRPKANGNTTPHFDIDIVIKREPLPATANPEDFREHPTAAITLGRDEVKVMKIDSLSQRAFSPATEVITVWDTEVPVRDPKEKIIPPTKLHVTHLNKNIPECVLSLSPEFQQELSRVKSPSPVQPTGIRIQSPPVVIGSARQKDVQRPQTQAQRIEPIVTSIRPQHMEPQYSTRNPISYRGDNSSFSRTENEELYAKKRTSLALEPTITISTQPQQWSAFKPNTRTSNIASQDRAIPKRKNPPKPISEDVPPDNFTEQRMHSSRQPTQFAKPSQQQYGRRQVVNSLDGDLLLGDSCVSPPPVQGQVIVKASSLEELRLTGLVADVKMVFSPDRDPNKQYFGMTDPPVESSKRRTRLPSEDLDYTRKWVEESKQSPTSKTSAASRKVKSPDQTSNTDQPWFMKKDPSPQKPTGVDIEPTRSRGLIRGKKLERRSKSLGSRKPSSAISQMTQFFLEEAELGATGRVAKEDIEEESLVQESISGNYSRSPNRQDPRDRPASTAEQPQWSKRQHPPSEDLSYYKTRHDQAAQRSRRSPLRASDFQNENRNRANNNAVTEDMVTPRTVATQKSRPKSQPAEVHSDSEERQQDIDDRPLAASAFKVWLGTERRKSLEQRVEHAYQKRASADDLLRSPRGQRQQAKSVPWWKQQNEMAGLQKAKPVEITISHQTTLQHNGQPYQQLKVEQDRFDARPSSHHSPSFVPQHQRRERNVDASPVPRREPEFTRPDDVSDAMSQGFQPVGNNDYKSPYANYQIQVMHDSQVGNRAENPADHDTYAQIRKVPHTGDQGGQSHLLVQVPPPKPERLSVHSEERLDYSSIPTQQSTYFDGQQTSAWPASQQITANNHTYYDPYSHVEDSEGYAPDPHPPQPIADRYEKAEPVRHSYQGVPYNENQKNMSRHPPLHRVSGEVEERDRSHRNYFPPYVREPYQPPAYQLSAYQLSAYQPTEKRNQEDRKPAEVHRNRDGDAPRAYHTLDNRDLRRHNYGPASYTRHGRELEHFPNQWKSATVDRALSPDKRRQQRLAADNLPLSSSRPEMRYNPRLDRMEYANPGSNSKWGAHNTPLYPVKRADYYPSEYRGYPEFSDAHQRPDLVPGSSRPQRSRSVPANAKSKSTENPNQGKSAVSQKNIANSDKSSQPNKSTKPSSKSTDKQAKGPPKSKEKLPKPRSGKPKEGKRLSLDITGTPLPDFIPIYHVKEPAYNQHQVYDPHGRQAYNYQRNEHNYNRRNEEMYNQRGDQSYNSYRHQQPSYRYDVDDPRYPSKNNTGYMGSTGYMDNRPRTGVSVMFNPLIGSTDF